MLQRDNRTAFVNFYEIAGRVLSVRSSDEVIARRVAELFSGWHFNNLGGEADTQFSCALQIRRRTPPRAPTHWQRFRVPHGLCRTDQVTSYIAVAKSAVVIHPPQRQRIEIWIDAAHEEQLSMTLTGLFFYGVQAALRRCGLYEIHAAGALHPATGKGALVVGVSGSGKSTIAMRLAQCGWQYLTDDTILLSEGVGGIEAHGFRRCFFLTETTLAACNLTRMEECKEGEDDTCAPFEDDSGKRALDPQTAFPRGFAANCVPRSLFFPTVTKEATSRLVELTTRETMAQLMRMCPWACYDAPVARPFLRTLALLAGQSDAYLLQSGRDILEQPGLASRLLGAKMEARA